MSQKTMHLADENMQLLSDFKNSSRSKFKKMQLPNEKKIWRRLEMNSQFFHYKTFFRLLISSTVEFSADLETLKIRENSQP